MPIRTGLTNLTRLRDEKMALKRIIPITAAVILLLVSAVVPALALLPNGQPASEFQLTDLSNNVHTLSSYRGKVVVIDFFMVSCSACREDAKMNLVPLYAKSYSGDAKVQFLSVETSNANADSIRSSYLKDTGVPWPVLTGGGGLIKTYILWGCRRSTLSIRPEKLPSPCRIRQMSRR